MIYSNSELLIELSTKLSERVDENCYFYIRFDKQAAFQEQYELITHGDCIAIKSKIKAYPARKDIAIEIRAHEARRGVEGLLEEAEPRKAQTHEDGERGDALNDAPAVDASPGPDPDHEQPDARQVDGREGHLRGRDQLQVE